MCMMWLPVMFLTLSVAENGQLQLLNRSGQMETFAISYNTILTFATGATFPPPSGFIPTPAIAFHAESQYPRANTCANTLYLTLQKPLPTSEEFAYCFAFGILNSAGFGLV